jgi:hypothetical protein
MIEAYFPLFNKGDAKGLLQVVNFPHIRIAGGAITVIPSPAEWTGDPTPISVSEGWDHSGLDSIQFVQSSANKVHALVEFSRYRADGTRYATYHTLWIFTRIDGHWGIQCRSSFAP